MQQQQQLPSVQSNTDSLMDEIDDRYLALIGLVQGETKCVKKAQVHWQKLKGELEEMTQCWEDVLVSNDIPQILLNAKKWCIY